MKSLSDLLAPIDDPTDRLRLEAFGQTYPTPEHLWLARCAAFPVALTTDLLYKIWLNFRQTDTGETVDIPINAVGDILLSPLCHEIGYDLYEIYPEARAVLWQSLSPDTVASLAEFTLRYLDFCRDKVPSEAFAEAQRISAEVILNPQKIATFLSKLLSERKTNAGSKIMADYVLSWVKNRNQWSNQKGLATTAQRDSLSDLAQVAEGIQQYEKGEITEAKATFSSIAHLLQAPRVGGFNVPIAKEIWENLPIANVVSEPAKGKIYAVLVGIDDYGSYGFPTTKSSYSDIADWELILKFLHQQNDLSIVKFYNREATRDKILNTLNDFFKKATSQDTVLFTFSGYCDYSTILSTGVVNESVSQSDIQSLLRETNINNYSFLIILDINIDAYMTNGDAERYKWIDINNKNHAQISAYIDEYESPPQRGLLTKLFRDLLFLNDDLISYQSLVKKTLQRFNKKNPNTKYEFFGHPKAINQAFLGGSTSQATYINELLQECNYENIQHVMSDFEIEAQEKIIIETLEKYALLKGAEKLNVVRISSEVNVRQIPLFRREYLKNLPYEVEIKDISLFYDPIRGGLKDMLPIEEDDLSALQYAHIIVFVLNRALVRDFAKHSSIAPIINHLSRIEYKVICSILWEDCDWQITVLKDYPVFSKEEPLVRSLTGFKTELEIKRHYEHDWQPVINKWITDLAALGFEKELKERIEKAKQTQELDLSGMGFEKLPEVVWELEDLKTIDLYNNKLTELPESLTQFQSLEKLYASKNPVTSLPLFLTDLPNLRVLKIDDAQITEFPNWLCKHPALEDISLENNQIEIIPSALKDLPKLRLFDFRGNPVINLSVSFLKVTKEQLIKYIKDLKKNFSIEYNNYKSDTAILLLSSSSNKIELENIAKNWESDMVDKYLIHNMSFLNISFETIFHFELHKIVPLIVHITDENVIQAEVYKFSKLFVEYPTSTIFFLNFSHSKRLAELLYQQKHSPIIAFEGELDEETAGNAVRYFYSYYQTSKNVMESFDQMEQQLSSTSSAINGKYILYRY